jgi:hypothetical protein
MKATKAEIEAYDESVIRREQRYGAVASFARVSQGDIFASAYIEQDGSGYIQVYKGTELIRRFEFAREEK